MGRGFQSEGALLQLNRFLVFFHFLVEELFVQGPHANELLPLAGWEVGVECGIDG